MIEAKVQLPEALHARLLELAPVHAGGSIQDMVVLLLTQQLLPIEFERIMAARAERCTDCGDMQKAAGF